MVRRGVEFGFPGFSSPFNKMASFFLHKCRRHHPCPRPQPQSLSPQPVYTAVILSTVSVALLTLGFLAEVGRVGTEGAAAITASASASNYTKIESPCLCKEFRCDVGGGFCLHSSKVCNRVKDCPNNEDEAELICKQANAKKRESVRGGGGSPGSIIENNKLELELELNCQQGEFKCKFGGCINITLVCDGVIHCPGATEEASDFCDYIHS